MRARLIKTDGSTEPLDLRIGEGQFFSLLGTSEPEPVELLDLKPTRPGLTLWHNPAALFKDVPGNAMAYRFTSWVMKDSSRSHVAGPAIMTGAIGSEGEIHPLTDAQDEIVAAMLAQWARDAERIRQAESTSRRAGSPAFGSLDNARAT